MNKVEFSYLGNKTIILCKENDSINEIIKKFANKVFINENDLIILYGGNIIKEEDLQLTFNQIANQEDKERKQMSIVVYDKPTEIRKREVQIKSKDIICPKCKEHILIKCSNYKIKLFNCKNEHIIDNLSIKDFEKSQYLNYSKIICGNCNKRNLGECQLTNFYKCYECNINLCDKCQMNHDYSHNIMNFGDINYFCGKHKDSFAKYCNKCKIDICCLCEEEHSGHKLILYGNIISNKRQLMIHLEKIKECFDKYDKNCMEITTRVNDAKYKIIDYDLYNEIGKSCEGIVMIVNEVKNIFNSFYNLKKDIINGYDNSKKYYHLLINLKEINDNNDLVEDINKITQENNIKKKFENIIKIYKKINNISEEKILIFDVEKIELKDKVKKLEKNYKDLEEENEQITNYMEEIKELNLKLKEGNDQLKKDNEIFQGKEKDFKKDINNLEKNIKQLKKEKEQLEQLKKDINEELEKVKIKNDNLEKELKNKKEELFIEKFNSDKLKKQIEMYKSINNNLQNENNDIKSENVKLLKKIKNIELENEENKKKLEKENKELKSENDNLKKESKNPYTLSKILDLEIKEQLEKENNLMKKKISELEKKIENVTNENNKLIENNNQIENNNKSSLISHVIEKGLNQNTTMCENYNLENKFLIIELIQKEYIKSEKVADVMLEVDRGDFTPQNIYAYSPKYKYANRPVSIGFNVTISAPHMHAFALEILSEYCTPHSKILDVGCGSGYLTLALSKMAKDTAIVVGIEHIPELYSFGIKNIEKYNSDLIEKGKIIIKKGDGRQGCKEYSPYKAIHVGACSEFYPQELVEQLDNNGRMFIPIGKKGGEQNIYLIDKDYLGNVTYKAILPVCYGMLTDINSQLYQ